MNLDFLEVILVLAFVGLVFVIVKSARAVRKALGRRRGHHHQKATIETDHRHHP
jgi:hypothetical protein